MIPQQLLGVIIGADCLVVYGSYHQQSHKSGKEKDQGMGLI